MYATLVAALIEFLFCTVNSSNLASDTVVLSLGHTYDESSIVARPGLELSFVVIVCTREQQLLNNY